MVTFSINPDNYVAYSKLNDSSFPTTPGGREWLHSIWIGLTVDENKFNDSIDMDRWGNGCEKKAKLKRMTKESQILTWSESTENTSNKVFGIGEAVLGEIDANLDKVVEESSFPREISKFLEIRTELMVEENIDLYYIINKAINLNSLALKKLRLLTEKYPIEDLLETILNPKCFNLLNRAIDGC